MRPLLFALGGACAPLAASLVMLFAIEASDSHWFEVVDPRLIRCNLSDHLVNNSVEEIFRQQRSPGSNVTPIYNQRIEAWSTKPNALGLSNQRASRLVREQEDHEGRRLRIEVLTGVAMPTLIFIEHDTTAGESDIAEELAAHLAEVGADRR